MSKSRNGENIIKTQISNFLKSEYVLMFISGIFILIATLDMPHAYYPLLRIFIFITSSFTLFFSSHTNTFTKGYLIFIGLLFNPLAPIELNKASWIIMDLIFGISTLMVALYNHYSFTRKCPNCKNVLDNSSIYCKNCGEYVQLIPIIKNESISLETKTLSMKWYKILINFFIPSWIVFGTISTLGSIYLDVQKYYESWKDYFTNPMSGFPNTLNILLYVSLILLLIFAYVGIRRFTKLGYKYIITFFIVLAIYPVLIMLIYIPFYIKAGVDYIYEPVILRTITNIILSVPNLIYFKKRKHLFTNIGGERLEYRK